MKHFFLAIVAALISTGAWSQASSQLTITPFNPTPSDTIVVVSTLSYSGNCSYGMVYTNTTVTGNTITLMPTYCGHGLSTKCFSTDTFKIAPLAIGNYVLKVEYHQGSICPISDFDATIAEAEAAIVVNTVIVTGIKEVRSQETTLMVYPNPAKNHVLVKAPAGAPVGAHLVIRTLTGEVVMLQRTETRLVQVNIEELPPGIYTIAFESQGRPVTAGRLVVSN